jgi:hypothetical protein
MSNDPRTGTTDTVTRSKHTALLTDIKIGELWRVTHKKQCFHSKRHEYGINTDLARLPFHIKLNKKLFKL